MAAYSKPLTPSILHRDDQLLVVDKPAGVLAFPGRGAAPVLGELLRAQRLVPANEPCSVVHRLDRDTSGVMVLARTPEARRSLTLQFRRRTIEKVYLALVCGRVAGDSRIDLPIKTDEGSTRAAITPASGKPSVTNYRVLEHIMGHTLLECRPETGRLHQIRVHLAAIGHPLAVDPLYGGGDAIFLSTYKPDYRPSRDHEERPLIARLTLHAASLTLDHPASATRMTFEAPLPKDVRATLNQL